MEQKKCSGVFLGQLAEACYMVQRGKPAALLPARECEIEDITKIINRDNLKMYLEEAKGLGYGWKTLWIYRYPHILLVIKALKQIKEEKARHWVLGKMFNYDENAIHEFLEGGAPAHVIDMPKSEKEKTFRRYENHG